ncbi:MAG: hypothetical protein ACXADY_05275 [Candidatus Hodarchaeales archaeon]|jgi:hypothetical protein
MPPNLSILVDPDVSQSLILELNYHLIDVFPVDNIDLIKSVELPSSCWNKSRHQFNANCLLAFATSHKNRCFNL